MTQFVLLGKGQGTGTGDSRSSTATPTPLDAHNYPNRHAKVAKQIDQMTFQSGDKGQGKSPKKAYVRCFPILAVVVTLIVSSRQILQHRMYYQMLRHGMLLDIENFSAFSDPLFWIVVWCTLNAFLHFLVNVIHSSGSIEAMKSDSFMEEVETRVVFFVMPACLYLAFLYGSYDTE
ncbi:unnamed protein product, partial [Prorocentrum cordatum]